METILAVDLKKGKVVRAFAGFRSNYKPLKSTKYNLECPVNFISKVLTLLPISKVYVADLDSIQNSGSNFDLISKLLNTFQHLTFLIDNGFDYPKSVKTFCEQLKKKNLYNFIPVVGTENLRNYNFQSYKFLNKCFFSLDFNGTEKKWIRKIKKNKFKINLILMFIKNTGGRGVRFSELKSISKTLNSSNIFYAGGVKYWNQLSLLRMAGVHGVLISTLIIEKIQGT
tara:strand:- start:639 stop:1319 length:681 start_codon:yes stop_codon:yes gene_type:complete